MTIVILSNTVAVNPVQVADVVVNDGTNTLTITMIDGRTHDLRCQYGMSIFKTRDELVKLMNGADNAVTDIL